MASITTGFFRNFGISILRFERWSGDVVVRLDRGDEGLGAFVGAAGLAPMRERLLLRPRAAATRDILPGIRLDQRIIADRDTAAARGFAVLGPPMRDAGEVAAAKVEPSADALRQRDAGEVAAAKVERTADALRQRDAGEVAAAKVEPSADALRPMG